MLISFHLLKSEAWLVDKFLQMPNKAKVSFAWEHKEQNENCKKGFLRFSIRSPLNQVYLVPELNNIAEQYPLAPGYDPDKAVKLLIKSGHLYGEGEVNWQLCCDEVYVEHVSPEAFKALLFFLL